MRFILKRIITQNDTSSRHLNQLPIISNIDELKLTKKEIKYIEENVK